MESGKCQGSLEDSFTAVSEIPIFSHQYAGKISWQHFALLVKKMLRTALHFKKKKMIQNVWQS